MTEIRFADPDMRGKKPPGAETIISVSRGFSMPATSRSTGLTELLMAAYSRCFLSSASSSAHRYAGAISKTVLHPVWPSQLSR